MKRKLIVCGIMTAALLLGGCGRQAEGAERSEALSGSVEASVETFQSIEAGEKIQKETEEGSESKEESQASKDIETDKKERESSQTQAGRSGKNEETGKASGSGALNQAGKASESSKSAASSQNGDKKEPSSTKNAQENSAGGSKDMPTGGQSGGTDQPAAHVCDYGSGTVTTAATCASAGVKTFTCSCGKSRTEAIPATGHSMKTDSTPASCTDAGKSKTYCTACGYVESEKATEGAKGHSFGAQVWVTAQSCTQGGYWNKTCSACGYTEGGDGEPLGHEPGESKVSEEPGCDYYGTREIICSRCEGVLYTEDIPTIPHIDENGDGECERCNGPA